MRARSPALWLLLLLVFELGTTALDLHLGPWSPVAFEEGVNARGALMVACGHGDQLAALQYRDFCGGCSAAAVLGAAPLRWLGPTVGAWKVVPAAFHALTVALLAALGWRAGGARAALAAAALMAGAPAFYRELALTGWGNHVQGLVFPLGAMVVLCAGSSSGARSAQVLRGVAAGVLAGLGLWFAASTAAALPAVLVVAGLAGPASLGGLALGLPLGLLPGVAFLWEQPTAVAGTRDLWLGLDLASPAALWAWWVGDVGPGVLWPHGDGWLRHVGPAWWAALGVVGLGGAALGLRGARRAPARAGAAAALVGLVVVHALRHDLWADTPALHGFEPFHLRYRAPVVVWLALGAGLAAARHRAAAVLVGALAVVGLAERAGAWQLDRPPRLAQPVPALDGGWPDATVPEGAPPTRNPARQGRAVDLAAAAAFVAAHDDPLPRCRSLHEVERGRRWGLAARTAPPAPPAPAPDSWTAWATGVAATLPAPTWTAATAHLPRAAQDAVAHAVGEALAAPTHAAADGDARVQAGACEAVARAHLVADSAQGTRWPAALPTQAEGCARIRRLAVADAWADQLGCSHASTAAWLAAAGSPAPPLQCAAPP